MKDKNLKKIAENLNELITSHNVIDSKKDLADASSISYPSLSPIVNGSRDFGVTKLIDLVNALNCDPNTLLEGVYREPHKLKLPTTKVKFLASCISIDKITYCTLVDISKPFQKSTILNFGVSCANDPEETIRKILEKLSYEISGFDSAHCNMFLSVQAFEYRSQRELLIKKGNEKFLQFIVKPDWLVNYNTFFKNKSGICITIGDGTSIVYSDNNGNEIHKRQGLGFPIADEGGNLWLGWQAIRHTINVKEGLENKSYLSDKVLSLFNSDLYLLAETVSKFPNKTYLSCSQIIKELVYKKSNSYDLVKKGYEKIIYRIEAIDRIINKKLPIILTGEIAYLYEDLFDKNRVILLNSPHEELLQEYGLSVLKEFS